MGPGRPKDYGRGRRSAILVAMLAAAIAAAVALPIAAGAVTSLRTIVEDVPGAADHRYGVRDNLGDSMDGLKIVQSPYGGYLGVYHSLVGTRSVARVASSFDLLHWDFEANLAQDASQPTIYKLARGGALVAYESHAGCAGGGHCLALRYYATESALLHGVASRSLVLPRKLSSCAEGTPSIASATSTLTSIRLSFHYSRDCLVDRQARGTLQGFDASMWTASTAPSIDAGIVAAGASPDGAIRDRDSGFYDGAMQLLYEAPVSPGGAASWRNFLWVGSAATRLAIQTHGGSQSFGYPSFTALTLPSGEAGVVVTQYVHPEGAAPGEAGELVYYRPRDPPSAPSNHDPTIGAAGDISCQNTTCKDDETSRLLYEDTPTKILTLGDNQYEAGALANFQTYFDPDWGRLKAVTMPSPGNHDPPSSGYTAYFGVPANYSFDLGEWHLVSLDSTGISAATAFLESDLAGRTNRCVLAYWHHPRFSSGSSHGNNSALAPLWDRLYAAGADVVLNGHEHIYERFAPQTPAAQPSASGIREFIAGTGGKALHSLGTVRANSQVRVLGKFGVLRMTLHPTSYDWRFQGEDGAVYDSGSADCV
jgi:hypothetical protein